MPCLISSASRTSSKSAFCSVTMRSACSPEISCKVSRRYETRFSYPLISTACKRCDDFNFVVISQRCTQAAGFAYIFSVQIYLDEFLRFAAVCLQQALRHWLVHIIQLQQCLQYRIG